MNNKADVKISLHFIVGLIFSVVLILLVLGGIKRISDIADPHFERDVVDAWVEDIELINQEENSYITELLSIKEVSGEYSYFIFQQTSKDEIGVNPETGYVLTKPRTCSRDSCICVFSTETNKFEYCEKIGVDQLALYGVPYDSEDYYVIANDKVEVKDETSESKITISDNVFVYRNGQKINFCFKLENQECVS